MKLRDSILLVLLVALVIGFSSCRTTSSLQEHEYLLRKNTVLLEGKNEGIDLKAVESIIQPKPNKRILGIIPFKIWMYNIGLRGKKPESKFRKWCRNSAGDIPVAYDSLSYRSSIEEIKKYLNKTGFFHSEVTHQVRFKKRKAYIDYTIYPAQPYRIRSFQTEISDSIMTSFIHASIEQSKTKPGSIFNAFELEDERERLSDYLRKNGYYYFNRNYFYYEVDTAPGDHQCDIYLKLKNYQIPSKDAPGQFEEVEHRRYYINKIYINTDFDPLVKKPLSFDTLVIELHHLKKKRDPTYYYFLYNGKLKIHPKVLAQSVFIKSGQPYNSLDVEKTQFRYREFGLFSFANVNFRELEQQEGDSLDHPYQLNCNIDLKRNKLHAFDIEAEGTNKSGRLGIGGNISYTNNNIFRGAEVFKVKLRGSLEFQKTIGSSESSSENKGLFNTAEAGLEVSILFPRFLIPIKQERFPKYFKPKTAIKLSTSYEQRPQYTRNINNLSFGYQWRESEKKEHILIPIDLNFVDVALSPELQEEIDNEPNDRIRNQYTDHMILGLQYSFIYNNQDINKLKNFIFFRGNIETAGNLLDLLKYPLNAEQDSAGYYTYFGVRYSQYVRGDIDFRFYNIISKTNSLVYRFFTGIGIPYSNSSDLPLEKGFYGGGANGMRGWTYRLLGPGSYSNTDDNFDRMGDIQIEANIEYRFPIYKWFRGGLFADIGNVWLLNENESYPGGKFEFNDFYKELAIDVGFGFRFDFDFFVLRLDAAAKAVNPAKPEGERFVLGKTQFSSILWNLGIGYPF